MHEHGFIKDILTKVLEEAGKHGAEKISKVKVKLGPLNHFTPQSFEEHFREASLGTPVEKAVLEIIPYCAIGNALNAKKNLTYPPQTITAPFAKAPISP